jgi:hypothetical protein
LATGVSVDARGDSGEDRGQAWAMPDPYAPARRRADQTDDAPDGTVAEVLAWVNDDARRAALALDAERRRDHPRSSLVAQLQRLAEP